MPDQSDDVTTFNIVEDYDQDRIFSSLISVRPIMKTRGLVVEHDKSTLGDGQ